MPLAGMSERLTAMLIADCAPNRIASPAVPKRANGSSQRIARVVLTLALVLVGLWILHRFLPALFQAYGHRLVCCPVTHRPRLAGTSKYSNFGRAMVGLPDMLGVIWLQRRIRLPRRVVED